MKDKVQITKEYYDGIAHRIYRATWDKDNHHLGIFDGDTSFSEASNKANENLLARLDIKGSARILDIGSGFGGLPRFIARASSTRCHIVGLNLSERENEYARYENKQAGLDDLIDITCGDFNRLPFQDESFHTIVSQDSMLHSSDKQGLIGECSRVLKKEGKLVFSDILNTGLNGEEEKIANQRINAPYLGTFEFYSDSLIRSQLEVEEISDLGCSNVARTYEAVRNNLAEKRGPLQREEGIPPEIIEGTLEALKFWVDKAREGKIGWGLFMARKNV
jgi:sarcosine/dimethylglycine N-methyltransferase